MPIWTLHGNGRTVEPGTVVRPDERLAWGATIAIGVQHVIAMFGATFLVPVLTGFPVSTTLLFSGLGTILFLIVTRNKLPELPRLVVRVHRAGHGSDRVGRDGLGARGHRGRRHPARRDRLRGAVRRHRVDRQAHAPRRRGHDRRLIGFNLAPVAWSNFQQAPLTGTITLTAVILFSVLFRGFLGRISIVLGVVVGYIVAAHQRRGRLLGTRCGAVVRPAGVPARRLRLARHVERHRDVPARGARAGRRERRACARRCDDDGCLGQPAHRTRPHRRRPRDHHGRCLRRFGHHDLRREHRGHGRDPRVLDGRLLGRRLHRGAAEPLPRRSEPCSTPSRRACSAE